MHAWRRTAALLISVGLAAPTMARLPAQDDMRDVVQLQDGRELRGRVFSRFEPDALVLQQGSRRERIAAAEVVSVDTVRDRVREFFVLRDRLPDHPRHTWYLVEWAARRGLADLARLQATDLVLRDPLHEEAHTFLGHRRRGGDWVWPADGEWRSLAELERSHASQGHPFEIDSEHFTVRSDSSLRRIVDVALDLERLHLFRFEQFGEPLRLYEIVGPKLVVHVGRDPSSFSAKSSQRHPYFEHRTEHSGPALSVTYFADLQADRPTRMFEVVAQHLIYRTLIDDPDLRSGHRFCGWGEVGLGQWVERCMAGPPGRARARPWKIVADEARLVVDEQHQTLANLIHRSVRQYYFVVSETAAADWAAAHLFAAYLLDGDRRAELRHAFFGYLTEAIRGVKGDSSSALDKQLGRKVETLQQPWQQWIEAAVVAAAKQSGG